MIASTLSVQLPPMASSTPFGSSSPGPSSQPCLLSSIGQNQPFKQSPPLHTYLKSVRLPNGQSLPSPELTSAQALRMTLHQHRCEIAIVDLHYDLEEERTRHAVPTHAWFDASWIQRLNLDIEHSVDKEGNPIEGSQVVISFQLHQNGSTIWIPCEVDTRTGMRHEWHYFETRIKRRLKRWSDNVPFPATISPRGAWAIPPPGTSLYSITPPPWYNQDDMCTWTHSFPPLDSDEWKLVMKKQNKMVQDEESAQVTIAKAPSPRKQRTVRPDSLVVPKPKVNKRKYSSKGKGKAVVKEAPKFEDDSDYDDDDLYVDPSTSKRPRLSASPFEVVVVRRSVTTRGSNSPVQVLRKPLFTSSPSRSASNDDATDAGSEPSRPQPSRGRPPRTSTFDPDSFAFFSNSHRPPSRTSKGSSALEKDQHHEAQLAKAIRRAEQAEERNAQLEREIEKIKASSQAKDLELARYPGIAANKEGQHTLELEALTVVIDAAARREADLERRLRQLEDVVLKKDLALERCRNEIEMHVLRWKKRDAGELENDVVEAKEWAVLDQRLDSLVLLGSSTKASYDPDVAENVELLKKVRDEHPNRA
ncbi:BQ2448_2743 [Microbotryum intermedium]|uniref:BQ2448_2743 protein n=1 Tax=Microbotryum intermedium TaxID=269621 RepID=A0A238FD92_9BASI|nr:BQ2448_2743 [Microbotryum intermedium]